MNKHPYQYQDETVYGGPPKIIRIPVYGDIKEVRYHKLDGSGVLMVNPVQSDRLNELKLMERSSLATPEAV